MLVLRLRDPRTALLALLVLVSLALWLSLDLRRSEEYGEEPVLSLPWGGEHAPGLLQGADGRRYGALSFALAPDGTVWVLDTARARLLAFSPRGEPKAAIAVRAGREPARPGDPTGTPDERPGGSPAPWLADLAVEPGGQGLIVADARSGRLLELDPSSGAVRRALPVPPAAAGADARAVHLLAGLLPAPGGGAYVARVTVGPGGYHRQLVRVDGDGRTTAVAGLSLHEGGGVEVDRDALLPVPVNSFALDRDGGFLVEAPRDGDPFARVVQRFDRGGRLLDAWTVVSRRALRDAAVLGRDRLGGVVLLLNPGQPDGRVVRLDSRGRVVLERPFAWDPRFPVTAYGRMDARGNLYLAAPDERGWHLKRLALRTRWRLVPAGGPRS